MEMDGCFLVLLAYIGDAGLTAFFAAFFVTRKVRRSQFSVLVVGGLAAIAILMPVLVINWGVSLHNSF
jgi:hypothetical protein